MSPPRPPTTSGRLAHRLGLFIRLLTPTGTFRVNKAPPLECPLVRCALVSPCIFKLGLLTQPQTPRVIPASVQQRAAELGPPAAAVSSTWGSWSQREDRQGTGEPGKPSPEKRSRDAQDAVNSALQMGPEVTLLSSSLPQPRSPHRPLPAWVSVTDRTHDLDGRAGHVLPGQAPLGHLSLESTTGLQTHHPASEMPQICRKRLCQQSRPLPSYLCE